MQRRQNDAEFTRLALHLRFQVRTFIEFKIWLAHKEDQVEIAEALCRVRDTFERVFANLDAGDNRLERD